MDREKEKDGRRKRKRWTEKKKEIGRYEETVGDILQKPKMIGTMIKDGTSHRKRPQFRLVGVPEAERVAEK